MKVELYMPTGNPEVWEAFLEGLVQANEKVLRAGGVPMLYGSGVRYRGESPDMWATADQVVALGYDDCDALAAMRAAELRLYGWRALLPGDRGYETAKKLKLQSIPARVVLEQTGPRMWHAIVEYTIRTTTYIDDPSARLGMYGDVDPAVYALEMGAVGGAQMATYIGRVPDTRRHLAVIAGDVWSPPAEVPGVLRVQAGPGLRAAVQQLEPGLFLVGTVPTEEIGCAREEIGAAGLAAALTAAGLKALIAKAAAKGAAKGGAVLVDRMRSGDAKLLAKVRDADVLERLRGNLSRDGQIRDRLQALRERFRRDEGQGFSLRRTPNAEALRLPGPVEIGYSGCSCAACRAA